MMYRYSAEMEQLEKIDNEKERNFIRLEVLLKSFNKYEEIRKEFGMVVQQTTTTTTTGVPGMTATVNFSGVPTPVPAPTPGVPASSTLEVRVATLEQQNALLRAELNALKAQQALQNQTFDAQLKAMQTAMQMATQGYSQTTTTMMGPQ